MLIATIGFIILIISPFLSVLLVFFFRKELLKTTFLITSINLLLNLFIIIHFNRSIKNYKLNISDSTDISGILASLVEKFQARNDWIIIYTVAFLLVFGIVFSVWNSLLVCLL